MGALLCGCTSIPDRPDSSYTSESAEPVTDEAEVLPLYRKGRPPPGDGLF